MNIRQITPRRVDIAALITFALIVLPAVVATTLLVLHVASTDPGPWVLWAASGVLFLVGVGTYTVAIWVQDRLIATLVPELRGESR